MRDGLRSILQMLSATPGTVVVVDVPSSADGRLKAAATVREMPSRDKVAVAKGARSKAVGQKAMMKASRPVKPPTKGKVVAKGSMKKRSRASA